MNCQTCQKESDNYRGGKLSGDLKIQVERHLQECSDCAAVYNLDSIADNIIDQEKSITPAADLTTRIIGRIDKIESTGSKISFPIQRVLRPALILSSMAAAIFIGVMIGNIYKPVVNPVFSRPVELSLIDDATIESVGMLSNQ